MTSILRRKRQTTALTNRQREHRKEKEGDRRGLPGGARFSAIREEERKRKMTESFGTTKKGEKCQLFRLRNQKGMEAHITDYGAAVVPSVCAEPGRRSGGCGAGI